MHRQRSDEYLRTWLKVEGHMGWQLPVNEIYVFYRQGNSDKHLALFTIHILSPKGKYSGQNP